MTTDLSPVPRHRLAHVTPAMDGWPTLVSTALPVLVGEAPSGVDWCCPECDAVIAQHVYELQLLDLLLVCPHCHEVGATPQRDAGQPVASSPVLFPPGVYRLSSPVPTETVMMVGQSALDGYRLETGYGAQLGGSAGLTPQWLRDTRQALASLLGSAYEELRAADRRGQLSRTSPPRRHRLMQLDDFLEHTANALESLRPTSRLIIDGDALGEVMAITSLLDRWRNHPAWQRLVNTLRDANELRHTITVLILASYLVDAGNGVGIVFQASAGRVADLWLQSDAFRRCDVEVKAPQLLRGPLRSGLGDAMAESLVEKSLQKAASGKRGQLRHEQSGAILAIGSFHLGTHNLDVLESAGKRVLNRHSKPFLMGLLFADSRTQIAGSAPGPWRVNSTMEHRLVLHDGYTGQIKLMS